MLMHPKDPVQEKERPNVVHCIPCGDCPATYVGQTNRRPEKRMDGHRRAVQKVRVETCALVEHRRSSDHRVDRELVSVLAHSTNLRDRLNLEVYYIRRQTIPLS